MLWVQPAGKSVGTQVGRQSRLLPALSVRQRVLLLTRDEGGAPHRAAVAVPEPAHRGWWRIRGAAEAMIGLCLCGERRGWAPHHHGDKDLISWLEGVCLFWFSRGCRTWQGIHNSIQGNKLGNTEYRACLDDKSLFITCMFLLASLCYKSKKFSPARDLRVLQRQRIKVKGTQGTSITCRWPDLQIRVNIPQCMREAVQKSNSNWTHGALFPIQLCVSGKGKYYFLTEKVRDSLPGTLQTCNTLLHVLRSATHNSSHIPCDTSPKSVQSHACCLLPLLRVHLQKTLGSRRGVKTHKKHPRNGKNIMIHVDSWS